MLKKFTLALCLAASLQNAHACTADKIAADAKANHIDGGCDCTALAACTGAAVGGLVALSMIAWFKSMSLPIPKDPQKSLELGILLCMDLGGLVPGVAGMEHCKNWDWGSPKDPVNSGKCGLQMCNINGTAAPLLVRRHYVEHGKDFAATAKAINDGTLGK